MELSNFLTTVLAGILGTVAMTLVMYGYSLISQQNTRVMAILGSMVTGSPTVPNDKWKRNLAGTVGHFGIGIIFSLSYFLLWNWGFFAIEIGDSLWIGLISGVIAVIVWGSYFHLHHNPPKVDLFHFFIALLIAHVVFGLVTVNLYSYLAQPSEFWFEFRQRINAMN
ncbi:hypothetical protein [Algoriphagus litoralis]|uniref:hypothetical protein n=1 Tax=Algoriphagus litoralis TaxID=2202829 RepID=UPI000DBAB287|nr:hypothetical protein [Algoriphagus litoralis]